MCKSLGLGGLLRSHTYHYVQSCTNAIGAVQKHCPTTKHACCHPYLPSVGWGQVKWKQAMESLVSPSKPGCSKWHLFLQQCWVSGISHGLDMAAELHAQLDDWALQHLAKRELPGRESPEGVGLCTKPLIFPCDNRSGNFAVRLFLKSLPSSFLQ